MTQKIITEKIAHTIEISGISFSGHCYGTDSTLFVDRIPQTHNCLLFNTEGIKANFDYIWISAGSIQIVLKEKIDCIDRLYFSLNLKSK